MRLVSPWLLATLVWIPLTGFSQQTTGSLTGVVTTSNAAVLPEVTVELQSPKLQGARVAVTDRTGRYRFVNLAPGDGYTVTAARTGFRTATTAPIHVFLGQEGTSNVILDPAVEESITVATEPPLIDVASTISGMNITATQFDSLPTTRAFQRLTAMAPGVTFEAGERRPQLAASPSIAGASPAENNYVIEGLSTTDPLLGISGTNLTMNFVEEVQVMTGGFSAEYGRSTGGVINVVTKAGGNEFHGDVFSYYQGKGWSPNNARRQFRGSLTSGNGVENFDGGASLGGRIMRDRMWFFGAYDPTRRTTIVREFFDGGAYVPESHQIDSKSNFYAAKLTWTPTPRNNFVLTVFGDPTTSDGWLGPAKSDPPVALLHQQNGGANTIVRYFGSLGRTIVEGRAGRHEQRSTARPSTEAGRAVPTQYDLATNSWHGGALRQADELGSRASYFLKLTRDVRKHEIFTGIDVEQNRYRSAIHQRVFAFLGPQPVAGIGIRDVMLQDTDVDEGLSDTRNEALFFEDRWKVLDNLQLNAGVRYERQVLDSSNDVHVAPGFAADGANHSRKIDSLALGPVLAPRLGLAWDPLSHGRTKLYAYAGRYIEAIPLDLSIAYLKGREVTRRWYYSSTTHTSDNWFNRNGSPLNTDWSLFRTQNLGEFNGVLDEHLRPQYDDEFVLGFEYQFAAAWNASMRLVNRRIGRVIEDLGIFEDPDDPLEVTGAVVGHPGERSSDRFWPKPRRDYRAVELTVQRRRTDNWQFYSSFVWARARGDYEGLYQSSSDNLSPNWTGAYDLPSLLQNAYGKLPADRPYELKVFGSYAFPWRLSVSEAFFLSAGAPISALGPEIYNFGADDAIFLKPRGSAGRTPTYWNLDLHIDYRLPAWKNPGTQLSIVVDIFNATNRHEAVAVDQDYLYLGMPGFEQWAAPANLDPYGNPRFNPNLPASPYFKTPLVYQSPRTMQVGLKLGF